MTTQDVKKVCKAGLTVLRKQGQRFAGGYLPVLEQYDLKKNKWVLFEKFHSEFGRQKRLETLAMDNNKVLIH